MKLLRAPLAKLFLFISLAALAGGCNFAPKYTQPAVETPAAFKENAATNLWQAAEPADAVVRSNWWTMFNNAELNVLEDEVAISNQNIAAAVASLLEAKAVVRETEAQLWPTLVANPDVTRSRSSANLGVQAGSSTPSRNLTATTYSLPLDASWQPDLWGRIRDTVKANAAEAQATAADLENTKLAAQGELAADYFQLRGQDALEKLFADTVTAYRKSYDLEKVLYKTGIASDQDVSQAETQLEAAEAQQTNLQILRAQLEHAIAMLTGRPPAAVAIPTVALDATPPAIPAGVPSQLLQRRPDVAAAERRVAEANAQIGVARAAYFPNITLSASGGFESSVASTLLDWPSRFWSIGAGASETIFDAGARGATVTQYRAAYDNAVAQYRQTVLTAFQQVEDNLTSLRVYDQEIQQQEIAVKSATRYLNLAQDRYRLGIDSYLNVITAQTTLLANRQTLTTLYTEQMTAAVQLIEALGGGWEATQLSAQ
jgi:NodT family efflux transporter outer membrane factor (OMF) lipoprotein